MHGVATMRIVLSILVFALALAGRTIADAVQQAPAPAAAGDLDYEMFTARIQPMFIAKREGLVRCVQCHGRGAGAGGFALQSPAEGTTTWTEEQSRKNFEAARRLVVPGEPEASRLLMHPLVRTDGGDPFHGGGKHWTKTDQDWQRLVAWVNTGHATTTTSSAPLDFAVYRATIEPIFLRERDGPAGKASCAACHSGIATRLKLASPPDGGTAWTDDQSRQNFAAVTRLVVAGDPLKSRLLLHPLDASAGGDPSHSGGKFWKTQDDPEWRTLAAWVRAAAPDAGSGATTSTLDYDFFKSRIQPMFTAKREGLVRCTQCHTRGTGSGFTLAPLDEGATTWTEEQTRKNFESASRLVVPGEPTASRLLMHPLARSAGGDPFHGGGKHWSSQSDPEWQTLASWVKGATTSSR